jgi:hypothetical protein
MYMAAAQQMQRRRLLHPAAAATMATRPTAHGTRAASIRASPRVEN